MTDTSLTREELISACADAGFSDRQWRAMTYNSGPYDITEPTLGLISLAEILSGRTFAREENSERQCKCKCKSGVCGI
jgi:hypothetical protein